MYNTNVIQFQMSVKDKNITGICLNYINYTFLIRYLSLIVDICVYSYCIGTLKLNFMF